MSLDFDNEIDIVDVTNGSDDDGENDAEFFGISSTQVSTIDVPVDIDLIDSSPGETSYDDECDNFIKMLSPNVAMKLDAM